MIIRVSLRKILPILAPLLHTGEAELLAWTFQAEEQQTTPTFKCGDATILLLKNLPTILLQNCCTINKILASVCTSLEQKFRLTVPTLVFGTVISKTEITQDSNGTEMVPGGDQEPLETNVWIMMSQDKMLSFGIVTMEPTKDGQDQDQIKKL